jgi:hypothetical protein
MNHPKAAVDRLYVPRKQGGTGLVQLEQACVVEITKLVERVDSTQDTLIDYKLLERTNTASTQQG